MHEQCAKKLPSEADTTSVLRRVDWIRGPAEADAQQTCPICASAVDLTVMTSKCQSMAFKILGGVGRKQTGSVDFQLRRRSNSSKKTQLIKINKLRKPR